MSWQEEYAIKYSERLAERWTVEGERIPYRRVTAKDREMLAQYKTQIALGQHPLHNPFYADNRLINTREICGND